MISVIVQTFGHRYHFFFHLPGIADGSADNPRQYFGRCFAFRIIFIHRDKNEPSKLRSYPHRQIIAHLGRGLRNL